VSVSALDLSLEKPLLEETIFILVVTCCHVPYYLRKKFGVSWPCTTVVLCIWSMHDAYTASNYESLSRGRSSSPWVLACYPDCTCIFLLTVIQNSFICFSCAFSGKIMLHLQTKVAINCWYVNFPNFVKTIIQNMFEGKHVFSKKLFCRVLLVEVRVLFSK
jgi:hypothetical protein